MASFSSSTSTYLSYKTLDRIVQCHVHGKTYDLRCAKDRDARFKALLTQYTNLENQFPDCGNNAFLEMNCLCFDYLSRHRIIAKELRRAAQFPASRKAILWLDEISTMLMYDRLVLRFVFKNTNTGLWIPFLSAQIEIARHHLSGDDLGIAFHRSVLISMAYWNAKQFLFARDRGLIKMYAKEFFPLLQRGISVKGQLVEEAGIINMILILADYFGVKYKIETVAFVWRETSGVQNPLVFGRSVIQMLKDMENSCGWEPCNRRHTEMEFETKKMYICKRCRLIKYCCRRHQKKHWKFIHSQQCKKYELIHATTT